MRSAEHPQTVPAAAAVESILDDVYHHVDFLREAVRKAVVDSDGLSSGRLEGMSDLVTALITAIPWVGGGGFVAALDTVGHEHRFWDWWTRVEGSATVERLHPPRTSAGGAEYAYESMQWFREGERGRSCVFGPFVDFAGVNQLVILCAEPVTVDGRFVGVVGADLVVDRFEIQAVRQLRTLPGPAVLVGSTGRVVAANVASFAPGERFDPAGWVETGVDVERARWTLHTQPQSVDRVSPELRR